MNYSLKDLEEISLLIRMRTDFVRDVLEEEPEEYGPELKMLLNLWNKTILQIEKKS